MPVVVVPELCRCALVARFIGTYHAEGLVHIERNGATGIVTDEQWLRDGERIVPSSQMNQMNGISSSLKVDCDRISQWFLDKLNEGSATSALMIVTTGEKFDAHSYGLNTVKGAIELSHTHLISKYGNAARYVIIIAYDAGWYSSSGVEQRAICVEAEERITASPRLFVYRIVPTTGATFSFTNEIFEFKPPEWSLYKTLVKE